MELNFKLYLNDSLLLDKTIDGLEFNRSYIRISDKYLKIKQNPKYYENSREGLRLRLAREITKEEIKAINNLELTEFEVKLVKYLNTNPIILKDKEIVKFFNSMHNNYYDNLSEIYDFYLDNKSEITKANLLKITKIN